MAELTPKQLADQDKVLGELRSLRREGETFIDRRDSAVYRAYLLGLSLRQIGRQIGLSPQGVNNVIARQKDIEESLK